MITSDESVKPHDNAACFLLDDPRIEQAMHKAARRAVAVHHIEGRSVPIMENGRIVWLALERAVSDSCEDHPADHA